MPFNKSQRPPLFDRFRARMAQRRAERAAKKTGLVPQGPVGPIPGPVDQPLMHPQPIDLQQPAAGQPFIPPSPPNRLKVILIGTVIVGGLVGAYMMFAKSKPVAKRKKKRKSRTKRRSKRR